MSADDFELIESPLVGHCICCNQYGTRVGVGHSGGFVVYDVVAATPKSPLQLRVAWRYPEAHVSDAQEESGTAASREGIGTGVDYGDSLQTATFGGKMYGVGLMALRLDTQLVAVVGGGPRPMAAANTFFIFSGSTQSFEMKLSDSICAVEMANNAVAVLTRTSFCFVNFRGEKLFERPANGGLSKAPRLPLALSLRNSVIAYPGAAAGHVQILTSEAVGSITVGTDIAAHENPISTLALTVDGSFVATASERMTLIRVWKTSDATLIAELRNSSRNDSPIQQLGFSQTDHIFCIAGSTLKIFYIGQEDEDPRVLVNRREIAKNQSSYFSSLSFVSKFFDSKWACCEIELPSSITHRVPAPTGVLSSYSWSFSRPPVEAEVEQAAPIACWWKGFDPKASPEANRRAENYLMLCSAEAVAVEFHFDKVMGHISVVNPSSQPRREPSPQQQQPQGAIGSGTPPAQSATSTPPPASTQS